MRAAWTVLFTTILVGCGSKETPAVSNAENSAAAPAATSSPTTSSVPVAAQTAKPTSKPVGPPPEGVILPDEGDGGPAMLGVPAEIVGEAHCGQEDLKVTSSPSLVVQTGDKKVYVVDQGAEKFAEVFRERKNHPSVRIKGVPYLKDGVLHLTAAEAEIVR